MEKKTSKKIIHLSDLHCGYRDLTEKFTTMVTDIRSHAKPAHEHVIVITGDLVDTSLPQDSYTAVLNQLERLKEAGFPVLVIPGNHDYGTGALGYPEFVSKFKSYFFEDESIVYPKLDIIGNIAFLGLDSTAEELHWYDRTFAEGQLGKEQLARLHVKLNSPEVSTCTHTVIYLHHHPFRAHRIFQGLKDAKSLRILLSKHKIAALLFGHNHDGNEWNGQLGIPRAYDGGSSTGKTKLGKHRVIDLDQEPVFDYDAHFLNPNLTKDNA